MAARGLAALVLCWLAVAGADEPTLVLHYNERPPYNISGGMGIVYGLTATPAAAALNAAGVPFRWELTPLARQFKLIEISAGLDCAVGLFRNPERERLGKFSAPLYRDRGMVGIARAELGLPERVRIEDLMRDRSKRLMLKRGLTYGSRVAELVKALQPAAEWVTIESEQMVRMLKAQRADWMLATEEEASYLIARAGLGPADVTVLRFTDLSQSEPRHLYCSRAVPDAMLERINAAIGGKFAR
ncbi:transporter substrate-binding domain-containing protein [Niveibacterium sp. 24ML]|uniref:transporter substrate-binding domain-containing protein n=1 Tax=Niveibacterium sp. 24ML TaxID=2985512 RepID=UPI00227221CB|nr:transporter substrate-binding domain-containing protein [Niveibacterium sp. 24ML]MCX9154943.1 transporter substrate-binding domain-containing protein [Niveibacterium sp. 24ML]